MSTRTPLAGGLCAGHLTQSHLLAARSILLGTGKAYKLMRRLREHSTTYLTKLWQLTVDRAGERDNVEARQRLQVDWAETKRRLGTHGRNARRQLMPGWVVVAKLPMYKIKHQLAAWKRIRTKAVLRGGQRTITSFLSAASPPSTVVATRTAPATAPSISDANRRTQTTIPFARAQPAAARLGSAVIRHRSTSAACSGSPSSSPFPPLVRSTVQ